MKKAIYRVWFDGDYGELWLDNDQKPIAYVDANDANFRSHYYQFIFDELSVNFVNVEIKPDQDESDWIFYDWDNSVHSLYDYFKEAIHKLIYKNELV